MVERKGGFGRLLFFASLYAFCLHLTNVKEGRGGGRGDFWPLGNPGTSGVDGFYTPYFLYIAIRKIKKYHNLIFLIDFFII